MWVLDGRVCPSVRSSGVLIVKIRKNDQVSLPIGRLSCWEKDSEINLQTGPWNLGLIFTCSDVWMIHTCQRFWNRSTKPLVHLRLSTSTYVKVLSVPRRLSLWVFGDGPLSETVKARRSLESRPVAGWRRWKESERSLRFTSARIYLKTHDWIFNCFRSRRGNKLTFARLQSERVSQPVGGSLTDHFLFRRVRTKIHSVGTEPLDWPVRHLWGELEHGLWPRPDQGGCPHT